MLEKGMKAPAFALADVTGALRTLDEFKGKKVVLYFYSKDNTLGCTRQALGYEALLAEFEKKNAVVIGVSKDSASSHARFAEKQGLNFLLLSDPEQTAIRAYDVLRAKKNYGKTVQGVLRSSFVIDEKGVLTAVRYGVKADADPAEALKLL